jgi:prophage regulatory protein
MSQTLLTFAHVSARVALKRTSIYAGIAAGTFPAPVKVGSRSLWVESEIDTWIEQRIAEHNMGINMGGEKAV